MLSLVNYSRSTLVIFGIILFGIIILQILDDTTVFRIFYTKTQIKNLESNHYHDYYNSLHIAYHQRLQTNDSDIDFDDYNVPLACKYSFVRN